MAHSIHEISVAVDAAGVVKRVGALDPHWARPQLDLPPFLPAENAMVAIEWKAAVPAIEASLRRLLRQPLHVFWSFLLHDASLLQFVDTFLRFAPREFALLDVSESGSASWSEDASGLYECVLLLLLRLATPRESDSDFLDEGKWRELVYDNWILDAPKLLDAIAVFGWSNAPLTRRLLSSILLLEPRYADDLAEALTAFAEAMCQCCGCDAVEVARGSSGGKMEVWQLPFPSAVEQAASIDVEAATRLASWLLDASGTLHALFYAAGAHELRDVLERCEGGGILGTRGLLTAMQYAAEAAVPCLRAALPKGVPARRTLNSVSAHLLRGAQLILHRLLIEPITDVASGTNQSAAAGMPPRSPETSRGPPQRSASSATTARQWDTLLAAFEQLADPRSRLVLTSDLYARANVPLDPIATRAMIAGGLRSTALHGGAGSLLQQLLRVCSFDAELRDLAIACERRGGAAAISQSRRLKEIATPFQVIDGPKGSPQRSPARTHVLASVTAPRAAQPTQMNVNSSANGETGGGGEDEAAVAQVCEMLPDVDADLVRAALVFYQGDVGTVVSALLEPDSLPEALRAEGSAARPPPTPAPARAPRATPSASAGGGGNSIFARTSGGPQLQPLGLQKPVARKAASFTTVGQRAVDGSAGGRRGAGTGEGNAGMDPYDDEFDDSFDLLSSGPGIRAIDESADDIEAAAVEWTRRHIRSEMNTSASSGAKDESDFDADAEGDTSAPLPHTSLEWLRALGLSQYEAAMRSHGMVRLELAAALTATDLDKLKIAPRHRDRLLASAALLAKRLEKRGKKVPKGALASADTSGYAAVQALHYDEETGEFWHEAGDFGPYAGSEAPDNADLSEGGGRRPPVAPGRGGRGGRGGQGGGPRAGGPLTKEQVARQRERKEQNKGRERRQQAARKYRES